MRIRSTSRFGTANRYATGLRNSEGLAVASDGSLWAATHGRDQLYDNWPKLFDAKYSAENPGEELVQVNQGDDFGWPYCYYAVAAQKLVLAPEYGGNGTATQRCDQKKNAVAAMPGHWAPMSLLLYTGSMFPARSIATARSSRSTDRGIVRPSRRPGFASCSCRSPAASRRGAYETFIDGFAGGELTSAPRPSSRGARAGTDRRDLPNRRQGRARLANSRVERAPDCASSIDGRSPLCLPACVGTIHRRPKHVLELDRIDERDHSPILTPSRTSSRCVSLSSGVMAICAFGRS